MDREEPFTGDQPHPRRRPVQVASAIVEADEQSEPRPTGWRTAFALLALANLITVALPIAGFARIDYLTRQGDAGAGYAAILFWPLALIGVGVVIGNIVLVGIYLLRQKPGVFGCVVSYSVIIASVLLLLGSSYIYIDSARDTRQRMAERAERQAAREKTVEFSDITAAEAERLLSNCDLKGFYFTGPARPALGDGVEFSATGIVLVSLDGEPDRISIADRWIKSLVPVAEQAQDQCGRGRPKIWHRILYP